MMLKSSLKAEENYRIFFLLLFAAKLCSFVAKNHAVVERMAW